MVERTNVALSTVRPMLTAVRKGRLTLTAVNNFFFRTAVTFGLPFRTAVSVSLPFRTAVSIGLTVDKVTFVRSTMNPMISSKSAGTATNGRKRWRKFSSARMSKGRPKDICACVYVPTQHFSIFSSDTYNNFIWNLAVSG